MKPSVPWPKLLSFFENIQTFQKWRLSYNLLKYIHIICPPTLEALVAMCYGEGALLHGQLVKFGELLKCGRKGHKDKNNEGGKKRFPSGILKIFPFYSR